MEVFVDYEWQRFFFFQTIWSIYWCSIVCFCTVHGLVNSTGVLGSVPTGTIFKWNICIIPMLKWGSSPKHTSKITGFPYKFSPKSVSLYISGRKIKGDVQPDTYQNCSQVLCLSPFSCGSQYFPTLIAYVCILQSSGAAHRSDSLYTKALFCQR